MTYDYETFLSSVTRTITKHDWYLNSENNVVLIQALMDVVHAGGFFSTTRFLKSLKEYDIPASITADMIIDIVVALRFYNGEHIPERYKVNNPRKKFKVSLDSLDIEDDCHE